ncbi:TPA: DsbA family protein [Salmonella enterica]|nr:DsbA family protein [Salmonella enterica]
MHRRHFLSLCAGLALAPSLVLAGDKKGQHEPEKQNEPATPGGGSAVGAHPLADGRAVAVNPPVPGAADLPAVMVFFSFYCLPCYVFSQKYGIEDAVRDSLPPGKQMARYHVSAMGAPGEDLTRAWSVAMALGAEDWVAPLLFTGVQGGSVKTPDDIRQVFMTAGIRGDVYDGALASEAVREKTEEQVRLARAFGVTGTPTVIVNGRWRIQNGGFDTRSEAQYRRDYVATVSALLQQQG